MSPALTPSGRDLTQDDYRALEARWLRREDVEAAGLSRVGAVEAAEIIGRRSGRPGIAIPYRDPESGATVLQRIRIDDAFRPAEVGADGQLKPGQKYDAATGSRNHAYFPPGVTVEMMADSSLPIVLTEGEFKALALWRLARQGQTALFGSRPAFLPIGLSGVWNWRGQVGIRTTASGEREPEKGVIPCLRRIAWKGRRVAVAYDADTATKDQVRRARNALRRELQEAGAEVSLWDWPIAQGKGVDDRLAAGGPDPVLADLDRLVFNPKTHLDFLRADHGNAERIVLAHGDRLRFCHPMRKWLIYDGRRWAVDDRGAAVSLARETMLKYLGQASMDNTPAGDEHRKFAVRSLSAKSLAAALSLAQSDLPVSPDEMDAHPFLLNFRNGTVDLRTGEMTPHAEDQILTKLVHHNFVPGARCPLFLRTLSRMMGAHPDASEADLAQADRMVDYLQRAIGYSLTGSTGEKAVFVLVGVPDSGKTTLLSTLRGLIEEYSTLIQIGTLLTSQENNNSQSDLADLRGARFVMTSESEEGQRLNHAKLKYITQGQGQIKAVRKYENPITFPESHKLWIDTNSRPVIRAEDHAVVNRLHPIEFRHSIPRDEMDRSLPQKLIAEAEGVLAWAVEGAVRWYRDGLGKPPEVEAAAAAWRAENDALGEWLAESCVQADGLAGSSRALYKAYETWAGARNEHVLTETAFGRRLAERGFRREKRRTGNVYVGLALMHSPSGDD